MAPGNILDKKKRWETTTTERQKENTRMEVK